MSQKRILYVCYGGGHVNMIIPIYQKMKKDHPDVQQTILALTGAGLKLSQLGIPYISFKDFLENNSKAKAYGMKLLQEMNTPQIISEEESIAYLGLSYLELVEKYGEESAAELYQKKGRAAFLPLKTLEQIIKKSGVDLVVATTSPRAEMAALLVSAQMGIKSLCLFDIYDKVMIQYLAAPNYGKIICVPDKYTQEQLIAHGRPASEIKITGNPAFDEMFNPKYQDLANLYRNNHSVKDKKVILWSRSVLAEDYEIADQVENALIEFTQKHEDFVLIVRPHPNEVARKLPENPRVLQSLSANEPIGVVLHASDIVVTLYSTVGIEGHLVGKKVIQYSAVTNQDYINFIERGIAVEAKNLSELSQRLLEPISDQTISQGQKREASAEIIDVIVEVLN